MSGFPKPARIESPEYRRYIRKQMCIVVKCWKFPDAHHLVFPGQGRVGSKVSDFQCVPCCEKHHREYHDLGRERFAEKYGLDFSRVIIDLLSAYILSRKGLE